MTPERLRQRLTELAGEQLPLPGRGSTPQRLARLFDAGREDLSLAKLIEAHWDAVAILAEAGRQPAPGAVYAVWAAEIPGKALSLAPAATGFVLAGIKPFCSGSDLVDRALLTAADPANRLVELDLHANAAAIGFDASFWKTTAFAATNTATATLTGARITAGDLIGEPGWYLQRPGFWHGALGPAACWAGGAAGLVDYALRQKRADPHTLAHLGAMQAGVWGMQAVLAAAGREVDSAPEDARAAYRRALAVRHLVEQVCTDILRRFPRAYGPHPLAADEEISRRYQELDLYLRQSHAERDLEALGQALREA